MVDARKIHAIERPHESLWKLYIIRSILSGPFIFIVLPYLYFRYHTLRYHFDEQGVSMRWGILFRREVNLTYARIQDIHLTSGIIQRWLGLADIQVQTASGSATPEMVIEGIREYEELRDYLYDRMRGAKDPHHAAPSAQASVASPDAPLLLEIRDELRGARIALERVAERKG